MRLSGGNSLLSKSSSQSRKGCNGIVRPRALHASSIHAIEVPEVGGDTLWADMGAAYDLLDDAVKERIDGLTAVHDWWNSLRRN